ncbi:FAD binding domain-containing protein [Saccharopolyspora mangrovi]|uniref:Xanthine dehydrogenase family protein subunit M n=1 Tax=Saccharopolyspora mangrovi TaxID=3082379 RepID=A0ABU6AC52_9PSEU|nr:xanthine dehydrogenase family protein subunit M [Saccharopolyspora sp. S2-29]MEB3369143.1 xanthine dehydrogenase family protein subunit M [Saccharopolyspora sp. S2-29]
MRPFHYQRVADVDSAVSVLAETPGAEYLAGGTNLVDLMKLEVAAPEVLVDVRRLTSDQIEDRDGTLRIGASVTNSALAADPLVRQRFPVLSQAVLAGASPQLRNLATTGGNLLQRTRCGYFQDVTTPCNKREPGSGCSAREGFHREHAILGASRECVATHPSDMAVALVALDAVVNTVGPGGARRIDLVDLHRLPGDQPQRDTVLDHGELITSVDVPPLEFATTSRYRKARDRTSFAFALVSVAAALDVADGAVRDVRVALGGVAHKPWRATTAEQVLRGEPATAEAFRRAADAELEAADPLPDNDFKVQLVRNMITGALADLAGVAR